MSYFSRSSVNLSAAALGRVAATLILAALPALAWAQAGHLDNSFGSNGIFASTFNNSSPVFATSVALQADGKIIVGGEAGNPGIILRLNSNGTVDNTFGTAGLVSIRFRDVDNFTVAVAVQTDGKILAVGTGLPGGGQLVRLNPNGSLDTSFGSNGSVFLTSTPSVLALQPDGKILTSGAASDGATRLLIRYNSNGQIDTTFGNGGMAPVFSAIASIALQADGKILVGSGSTLGLTGAPGSLSRYNTDGSADIFFGGQGEAADLVGPAAVGVLSNGQIITAGTVTSALSVSGNSTGFGLTGSFPSAFPNLLFGTRGLAVTSFPNLPMTGASSLAIQTNNFIVAAGSAGTSARSSEFALARYAPTGQLDSTFGTGGLVTTSFGSGTTASIAAIALQSDGKIVVVGQASNGGLVAARYLGH